ncbi:MAG: hypothetical protein GY910_06045 [bacterium]|nr:hypothetical protein [Deltaproteobacteria bacterium]MCP4904522.1 hypothetical protein [bacterium]
MAKLTIEIDMEDPQETWDALYRRIEEFDDRPADERSRPPGPSAIPVTYDLLLDPERIHGSAGDLFAALTRPD